MEYRFIRVDIDDAVATLTLNRPEARNALSRDLVAEVDDALAHIAAEAGRSVSAMVLTGAGPGFCAGGDIKAMKERRSETPGESRARMGEAHRMLRRLMELEMPTIAAVNGAAAGAGCNLALSCDFVLASRRARFIQSFARIGLVPDYGGFYQLPRIVGIQRAKELMFTGRAVDAEEARSLGMVLEVHEPEALAGAAQAFAARFAHANTEAIGVAKAILGRTFNLDLGALLELEAQAQSVVRASDYHRASVDRFLAKEPPRFDWDRLAGQASD